MSDTKHTAGPWLVHEFQTETTSTITLPDKGEIMVMGENHKVNARLIAAAPEMLEALEFIFLQGVDDDTTEDDMRSMIDQMRTASQNAIQKAI